MPSPNSTAILAKNLLLAIMLGLLTSCGSAPSAPSAPSASGAIGAIGDLTQDARMAWWRDARFGMFLHWGLYAIPAGKWGDRDNHGEWIRTTAQIPRGEYGKLQPQWNPSRFDADAWARMAKDAGMKYVVITSKHHDGFCLFDSDVTDWDVGKTPHGRDIMQELSDACRRHGLKFCTYHSIMDWHHPDYLPRRGWEKDRPTDGADYDRFERYLHAQVTEVITRYRPAVMWFDGEWEKTWTHERGVRLFELCRRLAPDMIVNNRVDVHRQGMAGFSASDEAVGDFDTPEQEIPATGLPGVDWESCMTMNGHWGWNAADTSWKSERELIRNLVDIASKGGNYLLNVGPRADGTLPPEAVARLVAIGKWMDKNGDSIRGTTASCFESLSFGRCTVAAGAQRSTLYLHCFELPENGKLELPGLANRIERAYLLANPNQALPFARGAAGASVELTSEQCTEPCTVVAVEIDGQPVVVRKPTIAAAAPQFVSSMEVRAEAADIMGATLRYTTDGSDPSAQSPTMPAPLSLTESVTLRVALVRDGRRISSVAEQRFDKVTPLPPIKAIAQGAGLRLRKAACKWQRIPDDRSLFAGAGQIVATIDGTPPPAERTAHQLRGFLRIDAADLYQFLLTSDDGSKLWIDGQLVVDNDGLHGPVPKRGSIALQEGLHEFELVGFNGTGGTELGLEWARLGQELEAVPPAALAH